MAIFRQGLPNGGVDCTWGRHTSRFWTNSWLSIDGCCCVRSTIDGRRCSSVSSQLRCTSVNSRKRREQNLFVHSCKSETEVTDNRRLRSKYCTIEANYWQTRIIARPLCGSRATCAIQVLLLWNCLTWFTQTIERRVKDIKTYFKGEPREVYASAAYAVMRCLSVCPSVTFVNSVKMNNGIFISDPANAWRTYVGLVQIFWYNIFPIKPI